MNRMIPYMNNNSLLRRNPFVPSSFDDDFFGSFFKTVPPVCNIRTDVRETKNDYIVEAELPGLSKENIEIKTANDVLTISAKYQRDESEEKDGYLRRERRSGSFSRSFDISGIDQNNIKAKYEDGLLYISLPKAAKPKDTSRNITID